MAALQRKAPAGLGGFRNVRRSSKPTVRSFDVFDTLLTRTLLPPSAAWFSLAELLHEAAVTQKPSEEIAHCRSQAENWARRLETTRGEPTLDEIAAILAELLELPRSSVSDLVRLELELERRLLVPVPGADSLVREARSEAEQVVFISATYLPAEFIRSQLLQYGLASERDRVIVSCEARATKPSGDLYRFALDALGVAKSSRLYHVGDDIAGDVVGPRRVGVRTTHLPDGMPTSFEEALAAHRHATDGWGAKLAGAARLERLHTMQQRPMFDRAAIEIATGVAAPTLIVFVAWLLQSARASGVERLNFLARDGQILLRVAEVLQRDATDRIELHYLYLSRRCTYPVAWERAQAELRKLLLQGGQVSGRDVADLVGLDTAEISDDAVRASALSIRPIDDEVRSQWLAWLGGPEFRVATKRMADQRRRLLQSYLDQEGLADGRRQGLVDLGWQGTLTSTVAQGAESAGALPLVSLYFGLGKQATNYVNGSARSFLFDQRFGEVPPFSGISELMEVLCMASHGQALKLERLPDNSVTPVLLPSDRPGSVAGIPVADFQDIVVGVAQRVLESHGDPPSYAGFRAMAAEVLTLLWQSPSTEVARALGATTFSSSAFDSHLQPIARPLTLRDVPPALRRHDGVKRQVYWRAGSEKLTARPTLAAVHLAERGRLAARSRYRRYSGLLR